MSIRIQLNNDLKEAMKNKDAVKKTLIGMIKASVQRYEMDERLPKDSADDKQIQLVIGRMKKSTTEAMADYAKGGRQDLVDQAEAEIKILESYLPQQMSDEDLANLVRDVIVELGISEKKQQGLAIKEISARANGQADGKRISQFVGRYLDAQHG